MSKEYIERTALLRDCDEAISNIQFTSPYQDEINILVDGMERVRDRISDAPTADVAEVVHGKWLETGRFDANHSPIFQCSECHKSVADLYISCYKHCFHCGTRMDKED